MAKPSWYKEDEYIHLLYTGNKEEMIEISFRDILKVNLNKRGESIPYTRENVINMERYVLNYWQPLIGSDAVLLYYHLWEYCRIEDGIDICWPKVTELMERMKRSKGNIVKNLQILEDNNFILTVHRIDRKSSKQSSNIYKLRNTIPMLSREQYYQLPEFLQKKHDEYMEKYGQDVQMEIFKYASSETYKALKTEGDKIISAKTRAEIKKALQNQEYEEYLQRMLSEEIKQTLWHGSDIADRLVRNKKMSKPSAENYLSGVICLYEANIKTVYLLYPYKSKRDLVLEAIKGRTSEAVILDVLIEQYRDICDVRYLTLEQYIIEKKKEK